MKKYYINFDGGKQVTVYDIDKLVFFNSQLVTGNDMVELRTDMEQSKDGITFVNLNKVTLMNIVEVKDNDSPSFFK